MGGLVPARRIYLDHNATAPVHPAARAAVLAALALDANPSSHHAAGRRARAVLEEARERVAAAIGARPDDVVLTSGGTESLALGIEGVARAIGVREGRAARVATTAVEHAALLEPARAHGAKVVQVDPVGRLAPEALERALAEAAAAGQRVDLVAFASANNEVGTRQPVAALTAVAHAHGALALVDAAQSLGREPVAVDAWGADLAAFSAHKSGGPQGAGALFVRRGAPLAPLVRGGGQERGLRGGTEGLPALAGFGAAAALIDERLAAMPAVRRRRDALLAALSEAIPSLVVHGDPADGLPNTALVRVPGCDGDALRLALDLGGVELSGGSACASGAVRPSHVLLALGCSAAEARGALRLSLGPETTDADVDGAATVIVAVASRLLGGWRSAKHPR